MHYHRPVILLWAALVVACQPAELPLDADGKAHQLTRSAIIVDTHIDVPYRLEEQWVDVSSATDGGDFDYPRAVTGGLNAPFMSIFTPASLEAEGKSKATALRLIAMVEDLVKSAPGKFAIATSPADIESQFERGLISLPLGMENGSPIEGDIANVQFFFDRGIRYITLAHSESNHLSDSSYDDNRQWDGLSQFGEAVVREMNQLGMMVDVSHLSDAAFYDVLKITSAPVIASHSSARHFTPGFERNMSDDMIRALAENRGVIMINFGSSFITAAAQQYSSARRDAYSTYLEENELQDDDAVSQAFNRGYDAEHGGYPFATLDDVLDHYSHVADLVGAAHVGIGSDFDGVGDSLPVGLKDVSQYPGLVRGLAERGFSDEDIVAILGGNLLRVWREVEAVAAGEAGES